MEDVGETWVYSDEVQWSKSSGTNRYGVVGGQALVLESVTKSWAVDGTGVDIVDAGQAGYNTSVTTVQYGYNGKGQMTGADGETQGETNSGKW
ncbi:MAG: hypothetical protein IPN90_13365 [Elusimicrobia bacterium]|nr:hypothetical protein [Elusimicrobiota bacterium]